MIRCIDGVYQTILFLALGLKVGKCLKTRYLTMFPCTWDFINLGMSAYSAYQCIPELDLKKIGQVLVKL